MKFIPKGGMNEVTLVMWEKTEMDESNYNRETKKFDKTGKKVEMTTYVFRDTMGEKLVFLSKDNNSRALEGTLVDIELDVKLDEFTKKTKVSLVAILPKKQESKK